MKRIVLFGHKEGGAQDYFFVADEKDQLVFTLVIRKKQHQIVLSKEDRLLFGQNMLKWVDANRASFEAT